MPFSFSRLFLGKRATVTEEDVPPCRPREFMPVMVDATTTKAKFGLKKIGRALKHKLRLNTLAPVPVGHGPLAVTTDELLSPFSERLQTPNAPSLSSLPHIPEVSSTLRREIRITTRYNLLVAATGANTHSANNDIYNLTPCHKRRTRSSSVLGSTDLPRPVTPSDFGALLLQDPNSDHQGSDFSIQPYLTEPINPLLNRSGPSFSSSEYDEVPDVLPLGIEENELRLSPPFIGRATIESRQSAMRHNWYTQQYVEANAEWSLPRMHPSDSVSSLNESLPRFPPLDFGQRENLSASSVYSLFPPTQDAEKKNPIPDLLSSQKSRPNIYSPIKLGECVEFFSDTNDPSPPAVESVREAKSYRLRLRSFDTIDSRSILSGPHDTSTDEAFFLGAEAVVYAADGASDNEIATSTFSTGTVIVNLPSEKTPSFHRNSLVLDQLVQYAPEAEFQPGPEHQVQITAPGLSHVITSFDLFATEEQYEIIDLANDTTPYTSSAVNTIEEAAGTQQEQTDTTDPSSPISETFDEKFVLEAYQRVIANVPTMADVLNSTKIANSTPHNKQVTFAKVRRIITLAGTIREEYDAVCDSTGPSWGRRVSILVDLISEMQDLKDDWYQDDQDLLHIGEHIAGDEIPQQDIDRDNATKDALTCLQIRLASAQTKIMELEAERDEAIEGRKLALIEVKRLQREHATCLLSPVKQTISTTPVGSPNAAASTTPLGSPLGLASTTPLGTPKGIYIFQQSDEAHMMEEEEWEIENDGEERLDEEMDSYTNVYYWSDSEFF